MLNDLRRLPRNKSAVELYSFGKCLGKTMAANKNHYHGIHGMLTPKIVHKFASQGLTLTEIAKLYGCTSTNISHAIASREDLKEAWEKGHAELLVEYTAQLKKRAFESDICLLFALKTQCQYVEEQYKIGKDLDKDNKPVVNIYLPDNGRDKVEESEEE